jgi:hypothetical protein
VPWVAGLGKTGQAPKYFCVIADLSCIVLFLIPLSLWCWLWVLVVPYLCSTLACCFDITGRVLWPFVLIPVFIIMT